MPLPAVAAETGFQEGAGENFDAQRLGWRDFFRDAQLQEVISIALQHNRDVKLAALAVAEAKAQYGVQRSERLPQLNAEGGSEISGRYADRAGGRYRTFESYSAVLAPAFEPDLFGRLKSMSESALEKYLAGEEAAKAVRLALVSQAAQGWLAESLAAERLQLAENTLQSRHASFAFIEGRVRSGQSSLMELEQARSMLESASAGAARRERELTRASNALRLLLGSFEKRNLPAADSLMEQKLAELPKDLSSTVLLGRPDVMEAEHRLLAANADIGAARAAFFPSVSLTGSLGSISDDLTALFLNTSAVWSFLPQVTLPIFTGGRNRANLDLANIRKESSIIQYEKAIQTAFREVADGLMTRSSFTRQIEAQKKYLASQRLVLELAMQRYVGGAASYLEVLDAQRNAYQAEQDLLDIRREQLVNEINLYSALGGGLTERAVIGSEELQQ
jgi:Cu(I)/Ag(I) efflux system outer membrane protein